MLNGVRTGDGAIVVEGLTKRFGSVLALDRVDFDVPAGSVFGLLGPNGSGKTTLIRILTTILRADSGHAAVLGLDVAREPAGVRSQVGLAGQFAAVDQNLTGRENLRLMGRLAQLSRAEFRPRVEELLERFNLADAAAKPVRTYSGGMRRRLDVAAALVAHPPVLFLDEPTTGLDPQSRNELWDMIRELVAEGATVLLTTQYLEEADRLTQRIAVLDRGRVIANDTPAALKARLGITVIELAMRDQNVAAEAEQILARGLGSRLDREGSTLRLTSNDGSRVLIDALHLLDDRRLDPIALEVRAPSLDDIFLVLTDGHAPAAVAPTIRAREPGHDTAPALVALRRDVRRRPLGSTRDALAVAGRNLIALRRVPRLIVFSTIQPLVFVFLFRYVFGGVAAKALPGIPYVDFLMPGVFVQAAVFGGMNSAVGLATDLQSGLLERFRSLPMARSAVLAGRTIADLARNVFIVTLMTAVGFAVGFRIHIGIGPYLAGMALVLLFSLAMSWIFAVVGLAVGDPETAQAAAFPVMTPLVFASSAFIPVNTMPGWLQGFARHQPVSVTASAVRALVLGGPTSTYVWQSVAWLVGIVVVFAPLGVWRYRHAV